MSRESALAAENRRAQLSERFLIKKNNDSSRQNNFCCLVQTHEGFPKADFAIVRKLVMKLMNGGRKRTVAKIRNFC